MSKEESWPKLEWQSWGKSAETVHLFSQIIGKIRLALMPMQPEWAQVPFQITSRGMASLGMPVKYGSIDIGFDFISHSVYINASKGESMSIQLKGLSVADFYKEIMFCLKHLNVDVVINPETVELPAKIRLDTDSDHKTYNDEELTNWWRLLVTINRIFNEFGSRFSGKKTPSSFFWGSFDLSITFFSGKAVAPEPGHDLIYRVAMDEEQTTIGFWTGNDASPEAMFFAYTYPKPEGLESSKILPAEASWSAEKGEFVMPYESIRDNNPEKKIFEFCESAYHLGTKLAGWDMKSLERKPPINKTNIK